MTIRPRSLVRWSVITWVTTMGVCLYASQVWAPYERQNLLSVRHGGAESKGEGALRLVTVDAPGRSELATPAAKSGAPHRGKPAATVGSSGFECCSSASILGSVRRGGTEGLLSPCCPIREQMGSTQGASSDQGGAAWKDTSVITGHRTQPGGVDDTVEAKRGGVVISLRGGSQPQAGIKPGRHLEVLSSGVLYETTAYSHNCTLPRRGHDRVARRAADGHWPIVGTTISADPSIPFGTELLIEGLGFRTVGDRGSAIKGRRIDVFVDSCREAVKFGRRWLRVYPVPPATSKEAEW